MFDQRQLDKLRAEDPTPNRVAAAVRLAGFTQRKVAKELGMTEPHLSEICRGRYQAVRLETAHCLAAYFGCAIEDLFPRRVKAA
jgi:transcriptional regulator with XRE-family HTH domain